MRQSRPVVVIRKKEEMVRSKDTAQIDLKVPHGAFFVQVFELSSGLHFKYDKKRAWNALGMKQNRKIAPRVIAPSRS